MLIAIDDVIFQLQRGCPRGISRVWANIIPYMKKMLKGKAELILLIRESSLPPIDFGLKKYKLPDYTNQHQDKDTEELTSICKSLDVDLFITTYHTKVSGIRNVVIVHDLIPEIRNWLCKGNEYVARGESYLNADILICVSQNTKKDLHRWYGTIGMNKVHVALEGVSPEEFHSISAIRREKFMKKYGLKSDFLILDGDISPKVSDDFCRAYSSLGIKHTLLSYGRVIENHVDKDCIKYGIKFLKLDWLRKGDVVAALAGADGLIFISEAEGFGLPVLEAMACKTPVLCSRQASIPEVGGDAVQYFENHSTQTIKEALNFFLDSNQRRLLAEKGFTRSKLFTWEKMAKKIVEVIIK